MLVAEITGCPLSERADDLYFSVLPPASSHLCILFAVSLGSSDLLPIVDMG